MKIATRRIGLVVLLAALAGTAQARTDGDRAVASVGERLRANDCPGAVKALNAALHAGYPEAALLAGTLFEAGHCVGRDWNKAVGFYSQAFDGGVKDGALRLAAGFAAIQNGPDPAAALWWARRARLEAGQCTANLPRTDDPDQFVQELRKWPAPGLAACNYVVGVISFIAAEAHFPMAGIVREIEGRPEFVYTPATSHFAIEDRSATFSALHGYNDAIAKAIGQSGQRYSKPSNFPPDWQVSFVLDIETDKSRWW
jgi:hypothetical protein